MALAALTLAEDPTPTTYDTAPTRAERSYQIVEIAAAISRLDELAQLRPGWLDGDGEAIPAPVLVRARTIIFGLIAIGLPRPKMFPTENGEIEAEWVASPLVTSLTIGLGESVAALSVNAETGYSEEREMVDPVAMADFVARNG